MRGDRIRVLAARDGADALIVTGHEAAGHGGRITSLVLVPALVMLIALIWAVRRRRRYARANASPERGERAIGAAESAVKVLVIPTNEEFEIARRQGLLSAAGNRHGIAVARQ